MGSRGVEVAQVDHPPLGVGLDYVPENLLDEQLGPTCTLVRNANDKRISEWCRAP